MGKLLIFLCHGWVARNNLFGMFKEIDTWVNSLNNNISLSINFLSHQCWIANFFTIKVTRL